MAAELPYDVEVPQCTVDASCEVGDHTYTWPCDLAKYEPHEHQTEA